MDNKRSTSIAWKIGLIYQQQFQRVASVATTKKKFPFIFIHLFVVKECSRVADAEINSIQEYGISNSYIYKKFSWNGSKKHTIQIKKHEIVSVSERLDNSGGELTASEIKISEPTH